jgi:hypothetical protein
MTDLNLPRFIGQYVTLATYGGFRAEGTLIDVGAGDVAHLEFPWKGHCWLAVDRIEAVSVNPPRPEAGEWRVP